MLFLIEFLRSSAIVLGQSCNIMCIVCIKDKSIYIQLSSNKTLCVCANAFYSCILVCTLTHSHLRGNPNAWAHTNAHCTQTTARKSISPANMRYQSRCLAFLENSSQISLMYCSYYFNQCLTYFIYTCRYSFFLTLSHSRNGVNISNNVVRKKNRGVLLPSWFKCADGFCTCETNCCNYLHLLLNYILIGKHGILTPLHVFT